MMVLQHSSVGKSVLWHISYVQCQSRDFPTKFCCNTINSSLVSLLFIAWLDPYFIFKLTILKTSTLKIVNLINEVGIQAIKSSETKDERW